MDNLTTYGANQLLNLLFRRNVVTTIPAGFWLGLFTGNPGKAGSQATELVNSGYARVKLTDGGTTLFGTVAANGQIANTGLISFASPAADGNGVLYLGILDASTAGNMWWFVPLGNGQPVTWIAGNTMDIAIGTFIAALG